MLRKKKALKISLSQIKYCDTWEEDPFKISYLRLDKMEQLENIEFHGRLVDPARIWDVSKTLIEESGKTPKY
jgi:hypothetical protein